MNPNKTLRFASAVTLHFADDEVVVLRHSGEQRSLARPRFRSFVQQLREVPSSHGDAVSPPRDELTEALLEAGFLATVVEGAVALGDDTPEPGWVPAQLGPYRLARRLGSGGFGDVYEAFGRSDHPVALKVLRTADASGWRAFKEEFRNVADLAHPNIVIPFHLMEASGCWFFTMELVEGRDLFDACQRTPSEERVGFVRKVFEQLVDAVHAMHASGLLHMDLKPTNVLVRESGQVAVLDFGLTRALGGGGGYQHEWADKLAGTLAYLPPEWQRGVVGPFTDWYAVGVMLFEALTGAHPFEKVLANGTLPDPQLPTPDPRHLRDDLPADLAAICMELLSSDTLLRREAALKLSAEALDRLGTGRPLGAFVGREQALAELAEELRFETRSARAVFVTGPPGIGKSALVNELLRRARQQGGFTLFSGRCYEREDIPYKGVDAIVDQLRRHLGRRPELAGELSANLAEAGRLFPSLSDLVLSTSERKPSGGVLESRRDAFAALKHILRRMGEDAPLVMFIDDLQWADRDSAQLIGELLAPPDPPRLLIIGTARASTRERGPFLQAWADAPLPFGVAREIELGPLEPEALVALVELHLGDERSPESTRRLAEESGGNPFLLGALCRNPLPSERTVPLAIEDLIADSLGRLGASSRRLVELVAVAGRPISEAVVLESVGDPGGRRLLAELRAQNILRGTGAGEDSDVEVYHDRIRECCVALLPADVLCASHLSLAHALELAGAEPHELVAHFVGAGEERVAGKWALRAGRSAAAILAFDRAAEFFANALAWSDLDAQAANDLEAELGEALFNAGRSSEAGPHFMASAERSEGAARRRRQLRAGESWIIAGRIELGMQALAPLLRDHAVGEPARQPWLAMSLVGRMVRLRLRGTEFVPRGEGEIDPMLLDSVDLCWTVGQGLVYVDGMQGLHYMMEALDRAFRAGEPARIARSLAFMAGGAYLQIPMLRDQGMRYLERAQVIGGAVGDPYVEAACVLWQGMGDNLTGEWRRMLTSANEAMQRFDEECVGALWERVVAGGLQCHALALLGRLRESGEMASLHHRDAVRRGDLYGQVLFAQYLAAAAIAHNDVEAARAQAKSIAEQWDRGDYSIPGFYGMLLMAYCDLHEGDSASAVARVRADWAGFRAFGGHRVAMSRIDQGLLEARVALVAGKGAGLRDPRSIARQLARETRIDGPPHAALIEAGVFIQAGDASAAEGALVRAIAGYQAAEMAAYEQCARLRQAQLRDDAPGVERALEELRHAGVVEPERWVSWNAPGFAALG